MDALFNVHIRDNRLLDPENSEILQVLGEAHFVPAKETLLHYALHSDDYYLQQASVLGLADWDLSDHIDEIHSALSRVSKDSHFSEWLAGLLPHTRPSSQELNRYYEIGQWISNDRAAGVLHGMAMSDGGKAYLLQAMNDEQWEISDSGVSLYRTFYDCARRLEISLDELREHTHTTEGASVVKLIEQLHIADE